MELVAGAALALEVPEAHEGAWTTRAQPGALDLVGADTPELPRRRARRPVIIF